MRLWLQTLSYVVGSIAAGFIFPRLEYSYLPGAVHDISVSSAQALLSAVASGMMALTAIVFSLAFVIVQFSGSAYSPRLVSIFGRDPLLSHSLGIFIATFVYALGTLSWIDRDHNGYVPLVSTYLVVALLVTCVVLLGLLVSRIAELQVTNVLRFVGDKGRAVINALPPQGNRDDGRTVLLSRPDAPAQTLRYAGDPMSVGWIDTDTLVRAAASSGALIELACCVGDTLTNGLTVMTVYGTHAPLPESLLMDAVHLRVERAFRNDPKYAFRLLVDIAIKALSPAINDPTTAVQSLDQIEDLLQRLARREIDTGLYRDAEGAPRLVVPSPTWRDYLALAFDEIRECGASQVQVMRRMRAALEALRTTTSGTPRAEAVRRYVQRLDATVESSDLSEADRSTAAAEDRQGLGVSR